MFNLFILNVVIDNYSYQVYIQKLYFLKEINKY